MTKLLDVFQDIPDEHLPLLMNMYKNYETEAPYVVTLLHTCIQWKANKSEIDYLTIMGMDNDWLKTGTFVVLMHYPIIQIFFHTLKEDRRTLFEAFKQTKRIDWDAKILFFSILSRCAPILDDILVELNLPKDDAYNDGLWAIPRETASKYEIRCPDDVYIASLNESHVDLVNEWWKFKYEGSDIFFRSLIENCSSYGVFLKSNDKLVAWVLTNNFGQPASLQTLPEYAGRGYATLLMKLISKEIAQEGFSPSVTILEENDASQNLFTKLGYRQIDNCRFNYSIKDS